MMIEKVILDYLTEKLSVPVYMEVPENMPETFVVVEKTGSGEENYIYTAMIAIQSYAETMAKAAALNESVKEAMDDMIALKEVTSSKLNSDYNYTDTAQKNYRYQAVYDVVHY